MGYESLSYQFGQLRQPYRVLMPAARDARTGQIVRLPGARVHDGEARYDSKIHKGHLLCPDCDARVHYMPAKLPGGGSNTPGSQEHFATNAKQKHDADCATGRRRLLPEHDDHREVDKSRGFQINLNLLSEGTRDTLRSRFGRAHGPYTREGHKTRYRTRAEDLKKMENYPVHGAEDLVRFLRTKPMNRIQDSTVIFLDQEIQWRFFMVPYGNKGERFKLMVSHMRDQGRRRQPVLMEVIRQDSRSADTRIASKDIFVARDEDGKASYILPAVYLDSPEVKTAMRAPGRYLVLGEARLKTTYDPHTGTRHFLSVSVTDPSQIIQADLRQIRAENERRSAKPEKATIGTAPA